MIHQLIEPGYYRSLLASPGAYTDWISYLIACVGLSIMVVPVVILGALVFRYTPALTSTLDAYCRSRIAWAWGCLFAMTLYVLDLCFVAFSKRLPSMVAAIPYYCLILLLMAGVILHKGHVRKELRKSQKYSK
jgi:hypothetical protein